MLIPLSDEHIEQILVWRNQAQVRKFSFNDHQISSDEHYGWWQRIKNDETKKWMIFQYQGINAGVVYYCDIKSGKEAFWGFYFSTQFEDYQKLKLWFALEEQAINYAFNDLNLLSLKCEVLSFNKAALVMHKRFGYKKINNYHHEKGEVIVLELQQSCQKNNGK